MKYSNSIFFFFLLSISDPLPNGSRENEQELTRTFIIPLLANRNNSVSSKPF